MGWFNHPLTHYLNPFLQPHGHDTLGVRGLLDASTVNFQTCSIGGCKSQTFFLKETTGQCTISGSLEKSMWTCVASLILFGAGGCQNPGSPLVKNLKIFYSGNPTRSTCLHLFTPIWGRFPIWRACFSDEWLNHQLAIIYWCSIGLPRPNGMFPPKKWGPIPLPETNSSPLKIDPKGKGDLLENTIFGGGGEKW